MSCIGKYNKLTLFLARNYSLVKTIMKSKCVFAIDYNSYHKLLKELDILPDK